MRKIRRMDRKDKIKGALYGFAIGDAMGATVEFMTEQEIKNKHQRVDNLIGGGWLHLKPGDVTDDTQMMICIIDAIMECSSVRECMKLIVRNFVKWFNSNPPDVGSQCAKGIEYLRKRKQIPVDNNALGNGSLMRSLPFALLKGKNMNIWQGNLTHNNKACEAVISEYTDIVQGLLADEVLSCVCRFEKMNPTGFIGNTYNNALYYLTKANNFEDTMIEVVNDGGDADTIAAVTGSLIGIRFGFSSIPKRWVKQLSPEVKNKLDKFVEYVDREN